MKELFLSSAVVKTLCVGHILGDEASVNSVLPDVLASNVLVKLCSLDHGGAYMDLVGVQTPLTLGDMCISLVMVRVVKLFHLLPPWLFGPRRSLSILQQSRGAYPASGLFHPSIP